MKTWVIVRVILLILAFFQGVFSSQVSAPPEGGTTTLLLSVFGFGVFGMLFVVGIQRINPRSAPIWRYPSWFINPFLLSEPLQFFHLGGYFFLVIGAGSVLRQLFLGQDLGLSILFMPAFGAGILSGVYACTFVYRGKMQRLTHHSSGTR